MIHNAFNYLKIKKKKKMQTEEKNNAIEDVEVKEEILDENVFIYLKRNT